MRKIALIMDGWKRSFTFAWPSGIMQRIHETNEDVNLYIFNSSGNWSSDKQYNAGEYNIYNLPDLKEFDGIILELNNISSDKALQKLVQRAKDANVPVISIANELADFYYAGIDNYAAMREVIVHLHQEHECKRFWFVMGPEDNYESRLRSQAMQDYMKEQNLPFSDNDFYNGDFDYMTGVRGFKHLLEQHDCLPDAVICANDNIAVAVCETAEEYGYKAAEDFLVIGFDNFDKASYYVPSISTVAFVREEVGALCVDMLLKLWAGEEIPRFNYAKTKLILQESCGCNHENPRDIREYVKNQVLYGIESGEFAEQILALESEMMQCNTIEEMMYCIPQCIPSLKCGAMYLVLDERVNTYKTEQEMQGWHFELSEEGFCTEGYPKKMSLKFSYEKDKRMEIVDKEIQGIFPMFDYDKGGNDFLFVPLHFGNQTIGYIAMRNAFYLMEKQYVFQIINALISSMENLHKRERLGYMNRRLSTLYLMDPLTGMYNRMGYQKRGQAFYDIMHFNNKKVMILFIDLDRLKYINDTFGHEYGDFAICAVARSIMKYADTDAIPARIGGDEYALIQSYKSDAASRNIIKYIRKELDWEAKKMELPFELSISVGSVSTDPKSELTMEEYVKLADVKMYEEKIKKKANRK